MLNIVGELMPPPLGDSEGGLERFAIAAALLCNDSLSCPVCLQELQCVPPKAIDGQYLQRQWPVERVVCFSKVQKDLEKCRLLDCCKLLEQLGFDGGSTTPLLGPKAVDGVMELHMLLDLSINDLRNQLP